MFDDEFDTSIDDIDFGEADDFDTISDDDEIDPDDAFESIYSLADLQFEFDDDVEPILEDADAGEEDLTVAAEASIFMDTVRESFDSDEEFCQYVQENAVEWELYGLIPSASRALEAIKTLKIEDWKKKNRQRLIRRECIRLACKKGDPLYTKYKKYRDLMRQFRQKIFDKYENKARANVLKAKHNTVAKVSNMTTSSGKDLKKRVDTSKQVSERGKNPTHAPNKSKAS